MYTKEELTIRFVIKAFESKKRIKEDIDLSFHSISVGFMLKNIGCNEETILSGLLHDILEDTNYDYEYIKDNYGKSIADNVLSLSEDKNIKDWKTRKIKFIENIKEKEENVIIVEIADKLHNLLSDYELYKQNGKSALATLNTTYEMNKWYYNEMLKLFESRVTNSKLLDRYSEMIDIYFND